MAKRKKAFGGRVLLSDKKIMSLFFTIMSIMILAVAVFGGGYLIYVIGSKLLYILNHWGSSIGGGDGGDVNSNYRKELKNRMMGNNNSRMRFGSPGKIPPNSYVS